MGKGHDKKDAEPRKQKTWKEAASQPRVRPQWDPVEVAERLLEDANKRKKSK